MDFDQRQKVKEDDLDSLLMDTSDLGCNAQEPTS